jgi:AcrR family transcriptional regulator
VERRVEILNAAAQAFGESGYSSSSLREIAERLGISHTVITFHLRTKDELLAAVLAHQEATFDDVLDHATERPLEFLAAVVRLF